MLSSINDVSKKSDWSGNRLDVALIDYLEVKLRRDIVVEYMQDLKNQIRKTIPFNNYGLHAEVLHVRGDKYRIILKGKAKDIIEKCNQLNISIPDNQKF